MASSHVFRLVILFTPVLLIGCSSGSPGSSAQGDGDTQSETPESPECIESNGGCDANNPCCEPFTCDCGLCLPDGGEGEGICPDGWDHYNGHCYNLTRQVGAWEEAESQAVAVGGHLVAVNDDDEQRWLVGKFLCDQGCLWIGLYQLQGTHEPGSGWAWTSEQPVTYTNWMGGEPDQATLTESTENRAAMCASETGSWNVVAAEMDYSGIIEVPSSGSVFPIPTPSPSPVPEGDCGDWTVDAGEDRTMASSFTSATMSLIGNVYGTFSHLTVAQVMDWSRQFEYEWRQVGGPPATLEQSSGTPMPELLSFHPITGATLELPYGKDYLWAGLLIYWPNWDSPPYKPPAGTYVFELTVTNALDGQTQTDTVSIILTECACGPDYGFPCPPEWGCP